MKTKKASMNCRVLRRLPSLRCRDTKGFQLVEMLVAIGLLSFFLGQVMDGLAQLHQAATDTQNRDIALNAVQELFDLARDQNYQTLQANADSAFHTVPVYASSTNPFVQPSNPDYITEPLMTNMSPSSGFTFSSAGLANLFQGTVQQQIVDNGNGTLNLTVQVMWPSTTAGGQRKMTMETMISQAGLHYR